ncbi:MAG: type II secretion system protein GspK [Pirellulaceae bacterium]|nr:type II secretion system protein GspK [Pirellulaceae bacterium]HJN09328.1 type II secretion system protein GspK [Pirellulaceae bacterium]
MTRFAKCRRNGVVLIVVLVLVLLMSVAAYGFLLSMQTENVAAGASGDHLTAQQSAFSAIELLSAVLEMPRVQRRELGGVTNNPDLFSGVPLDDTVAVADEDVPRFVVAAPDSAPQQDVSVRFGAVDESAKLHLGRLVEWDELQPESGRQALLRLPGMTPDVADAILDWVDTDSQPRFEGAEFDTYAGHRIPVKPRNGKPVDMEELLLVRGIDEARLFGVTTDLANEPDLLTEEGPYSWRGYLTVYSGERNESRDGLPRVFLNHPELDSLHQQLVERMPISWANFIVLYRQYGLGGSSDQTTTPDQVTLDFTLPAAHRIESPLDLIDGTVSVPRNGKTVSVASPFSSEPPMMQSQLPEFLDQVAVTSDTRFEGRVNINLAPREVLLAVPGIDESLAERVLAARSMAGENNAGRDHPVWLLTEDLVDLATMRKLLPNVNAGGDVFYGEFLGSTGQHAPVYRCEAVIDAAGQAARQVYFRELVIAKQLQPHELSFSP